MYCRARKEGYFILYTIGRPVLLDANRKGKERERGSESENEKRNEIEKHT